MLVKVNYRNQIFDITCSPEIEIDRILHDDAEEWFGDLDPAAWAYANIEDLVKARQADSDWHKVLGELGITYELAVEDGEGEEELKKHKKLPDDMQRVFKYDGHRLDGKRTLSSYSIKPRSTLFIELARKPKAVKLFKQKGELTLRDRNGNELHLAVTEASKNATIKHIKRQASIIQDGRPELKKVSRKKEGAAGDCRKRTESERSAKKNSAEGTAKRTEGDGEGPRRRTRTADMKKRVRTRTAEVKAGGGDGPADSAKTGAGRKTVGEGANKDPAAAEGKADQEKKDGEKKAPVRVKMSLKLKKGSRFEFGPPTRDEEEGGKSPENKPVAEKPEEKPGEKAKEEKPAEASPPPAAAPPADAAAPRKKTAESAAPAGAGGEKERKTTDGAQADGAAEEQWAEEEEWGEEEWDEEEWDEDEEWEVEEEDDDDDDESDEDYQVELPDGTVVDHHLNLGDAARILERGPSDRVSDRAVIKVRLEEEEPPEDHAVTRKKAKKRKFEVVIIEMGSFRMKVGYGGDEEPTRVEATCVGVLKPEFRSALSAGQASLPQTIVGNDAHLQQRKEYAIIYPIRGVDTDWHAAHQIWNNLFYTKLQHKPEHSPVFVTIPIMSPKSYRDGLLTMMFQEVCVLRAFLVNASALPLRALDKRTGLVCDVGHSATFIVPIYEGIIVQHAVCRLMHPRKPERELGGLALTDELMELMLEGGLKAIGEGGDYRKKQLIQNAKEECCYISMDPDVEEESSRYRAKKTEGIYFDNGSSHKLGTERFQIPELLFEARVADKPCTGIHNIILDSVKRCEVDIRMELFANIVLAGGTSRMWGFEERLDFELRSRVPSAVTISVEQTDSNAHFKGASKWAKEDMEFETWLAYKDWWEHGTNLLSRKAPNLLLQA